MGENPSRAVSAPFFAEHGLFPFPGPLPAEGALPLPGVFKTQRNIDEIHQRHTL